VHEAVPAKENEMANNNNPFSVFYAIVEQARTASPERFVIAYRSEQSLREFLVSSCIVATGYHSREEAARGCEVPALLLAAA
jgi:hypothetical protein